MGDGDKYRNAADPAPPPVVRMMDAPKTLDAISPDQSSFLEKTTDQSGQSSDRNDEKVKLPRKSRRPWDHYTVGLSPRKRCATKVEVTDAIKTGARNRVLLRSSMISSNTKVIAESGVLKAAAEVRCGVRPQRARPPFLFMFPNRPADELRSSAFSI